MALISVVTLIGNFGFWIVLGTTGISRIRDGVREEMSKKLDDIWKHIDVQFDRVQLRQESLSQQVHDRTLALERDFNAYKLFAANTYMRRETFHAFRADLHLMLHTDKSIADIKAILEDRLPPNADQA